MEANQPNEKRPVRVDLRNGETIEGIFEGYQPASLRFGVNGALLDIPFALIPEDLQRVFPQDGSQVLEKISNCTKQAKAILQQVEDQPDWGTLIDEAGEALSAASNLIKDLEARLLIAQSKTEALIRENEALLKRQKIS